MNTPILIFDGDCAFCTSCVRWIRRRLRRHPDIQPWQETDLESLGLNVARCTEALQFVDAAARIHSGERAVARLLIHAGSGWSLLGRIILVPGIRPLAGWIYRRVAANRHRLPGGTPACQMPEPDRTPMAGQAPVAGMEKSDDAR